MTQMAQTAVERFAANLSVLLAEYGAVTRLAEHMGWSRVHASRVVNGHAVVSMEDADSISAFVGFPLTDLLLPPKKFSAILKKCS